MGFPKGHPLAHDFAKQSVVCYTLCRRCRENAIAAGIGNGILKRQESGPGFATVKEKIAACFHQPTGRI